jgi:hypothetical protein
MTRPRDSQRSRLYAAERGLQHGVHVMRTRNAPERWSVDQCQRYVDGITESAWFVRRWGKRRILVLPGRNGGHGNGDFITLGVWARQEIVVLHELAHCLAPRECAAHGPEFAGVLLFLVRTKLGTEAWTKLRGEYRRHRVRVSNRALPSPSQHKLEQVRRAARERKAAANRPPARWDVATAAATIRRAVKAGQLGASGRRPRTHALETARALEKLCGK